MPEAEPGPHLHRLRTRAQFQAVLAQRPVARTPHFALHRLPLQVGREGVASFAQSQASDADIWIGAMTPKRWARRAVTRNAVRRQIYAVAHERAAGLKPGAHVIRLRASFNAAQFPSARSVALQRAVRAELLELLGEAP